jgi:hypothetical protein
MPDVHRWLHVRRQCSLRSRPRRDRYASLQSGKVRLRNDHQITPTHEGHRETILFDFLPSSLGPEAGLIADGSGKLYGTSAGGGDHGERFAFDAIP